MVKKVPANQSKKKTRQVLDSFYSQLYKKKYNVNNDSVSEYYDSEKNEISDIRNHETSLSNRRNALWEAYDREVSLYNHLESESSLNKARRSILGSTWKHLNIYMIVVETIVAKFINAIMSEDKILKIDSYRKGKDPVVNHVSQCVEEILDYQSKRISDGFNLRSVCDRSIRIMLIEGSCVEKVSWDKRSEDIYETGFFMMNEEGSYFLSQDRCNRIFVEGDPALPNAEAQGYIHPVPVSFHAERRNSNGAPKISSLSLGRDVIIPRNIDSVNIDDWEYIIHKNFLSERQIKDKFDSPLVYSDSMYTKDFIDKCNSDNDAGDKYSIWEYYGKLKIDNEEREVIVYFGSYNEDLSPLGYTFPIFSKRPFIFRQLIPHPNRVTGISIVELIRHPKETMDNLINMFQDNVMRTLSPVIALDKKNKTNAREYKLNTLKPWFVDSPGDVRLLNFGQQNYQPMDLINFIFGIVQRITGVSDYAAGTDSSIVKNSTATGITSIIEEGNLRFRYFIKNFQQINIELFERVMQYNKMFLDVDKQINICGEAVFNRSDISDIISSFSVVMTGSDISMSATRKINGLRQYNQMMAELVQSQQATMGVIDPMLLNEMSQQIANALDIDIAYDYERFAQLQQQAQQAQQEKVDKDNLDKKKNDVIKQLNKAISDKNKLIQVSMSKGGSREGSI